MIYKGKGGLQYDLSATPLAAGGEGEIFNINGNSNSVAKIYKPGKATLDKERKLVKMINDPPDNRVLSQIAWPQDVLYNAGQFAGFIMPKMNINDDLNVVYEYGTAAKYPNMPWENRLIIAENLCAVLDSVHVAGHICGDFNPKNISVNPNTGHIVFLDTDSYHIKDGTETYRCDVGIPEYLPPEVQVKMRGGGTLATAALPTFTKNTDNFALAIHIFQLLMNGVHPFACAIIPTQSSVTAPQPSDNIVKGSFPFMQNIQGVKIPAYAPKIDILPKDIQNLFERAFVDGHFNPNARPSPAEWHKALQKLRGELSKCNQVAHHQYYRVLSSCPWCQVNNTFNQSFSPKSTLTQTTIKPPSYTPPPPRVTPPPSGSYSGSPYTSNPSGGHGTTPTGNNINDLIQKFMGLHIYLRIAIVAIVLIIGFNIIRAMIPSPRPSNYAPPTTSHQTPSNPSSNSQAGGTNTTSPSNNSGNNSGNNQGSNSGSNAGSSSGNNSNSGQSSTNPPTEPPAPPVRLLQVDSITKNELTIPIIESSLYENVDAIIRQFNGNITSNGQKDTYEYTPPRDGRYRFEIADLTRGSDNRVDISIHTIHNERVSSDTWLSNGSGLTVDLVATNDYIITISHRSGLDSYTLLVGQQKETVDISNNTEVVDSIQFNGQSNLYTFTPPRDGRYRFEISGLTRGSDNRVDMSIRTIHNENVSSDTWLSNGSGLTVDLVASDSYIISIRHRSGFDSYTLIVGQQKDSVDVSSYTEVADSIQFTSQANLYSFTPPRDGRYRFEISGLTRGSDNRVDMSIRTIHNENVSSDTWLSNGSGLTVDLVASDSYIISIRHRSGFDSYTLIVGHQKDSVDVSSYTEVADSIQFTSQANIYLFTPPRNGKYRFEISGLTQGSDNRVDMSIRTIHNENVSSDTWLSNGSGLTVDLVTSNSYVITVRHRSGFDSYKLKIIQQ